MDWAFRGNLHQFVVLFCAQWTGQFNLHFNSVQHSLFRFAFLTIFRVNT